MKKSFGNKKRIVYNIEKYYKLFFKIWIDEKHKKRFV